MNHQLDGSTLSAQDMQDIDQYLAKIEQIIFGKMVSLTGEERQRYASVNEQNKLFINKIKAFRESNPNSPNISQDIDWTAFEEDYQKREFLETRLSRLESLAYDFKSSKIAHDYRNMQDSLLFYRYSEYCASAKKSGAVELYNELKQFFK